MNIIRTLLQARASAWQHALRAANDQRQLHGGVDIYEHERRIAEQARTRLALYASGVGR